MHIVESDDKKEVGCMCDVAERLERKGIEIGHLEAIQRIIAKKLFWILVIQKKNTKRQRRSYLFRHNSGIKLTFTNITAIMEM